MRIGIGTVSPTSPFITQLVSAIQNQEGFYPGSLSWQNNNPGNLVYVGQPGASPGAGGFASYPTLQAGQQAEASQIALDINRGTCATGAPVVSLTDLLNCLTPPSQNNTPAYISAVSAATGIDPAQPLMSLDSTGAPPSSVPGLTDSSDDSSDTPGMALYGSVSDDSTTAIALAAAAGLALWLAFRK